MTETLLQMWAFEKFPAKISYTPERKHDPPDAPTYFVEVFGYLQTGGDMEGGVSLVVFRESFAWIGLDDVGGIKMLPIAEFKKRFGEYTLTG